MYKNNKQLIFAFSLSVYVYTLFIMQLFTMQLYIYVYKNNKQLIFNSLQC